MDSFNSEEYIKTSKPEVAVIAAGPDARTAFGHRYGSQCLTLSNDLIQELMNGKQLAVDIMEGEYVLFINRE